MKLERVIFGPTDRFMEHLKKQGIDYQVSFHKRYPTRIDVVSFIHTENYRVYTNGLMGMSQIFRELGSKEWQAK